jgi:hypothetical protein
MMRKTLTRVLFSTVVLAGTARGQNAPPPPASQNPSPMVEHTRAHERLLQKQPEGIERTFAGPNDKPIQVFVPASVRADRPIDLVIHFLGAAYIAEQAVAMLGQNTVLANVSIGAGTGIYDRSFSEPVAFDSLLRSVAREVGTALHTGDIRLQHITLTGFSAGHGAIRAILRDSAHFTRVDAVLLIDGLHTSYVPEGVVMEKGGTLDESKLVDLARFARAAMRGEKRMLITHSEIFPGTFASTTETTDWLINALGLRREPVLKWGPRGLQQLSEVKSGRFELRGYAGNSAPDHIDQFQALPELLTQLRGQ